MKIYFPYGKSLGDFHSSLGRYFPKLKDVRNDIYEIVKSVQPFCCHHNWLVDFCEITNKIKHVEQRKQNRHQKKKITLGDVFQVKYHDNGNSNMVISGNTFYGVKQESDIVVKNGDSKMTNSSQPFEFTNFSEFTFKDTNLEVFDLINTTYINIKRFVGLLYAAL
jgi:hypothetical protein